MHEWSRSEWTQLNKMSSTILGAGWLMFAFEVVNLLVRHYFSISFMGGGKIVMVLGSTEPAGTLPSGMAVISAGFHSGGIWPMSTVLLTSKSRYSAEEINFENIAMLGPSPVVPLVTRGVLLVRRSLGQKRKLQCLVQPKHNQTLLSLPVWQF